MIVPEFKMYNPSIQYMDEYQLMFYRKVEATLRNGIHIDVNGNISYIFVYLYDLLNKWNEIGFENLSEHLIYISELYIYEKKISDYCLTWAYDCLLGQKKYLDFLDKTESAGLNSSYYANLRLNIRRELNLEPDPIDIISLSSHKRKSRFISSNEPLYKDSLIKVFNGFSKDNNGWKKIIKEWEEPKSLYPHLLFIGTAVKGMPKLEFPICALYSDINSDLIKTLSKKAENLARKEIGVPLVGEGWISETELYRKLSSEFNMTKVVQHGRPSWLGRQHFDIWIPHWKVAIEYHGKQHFEPVDFFGGIEALEKNIERDRRKERLAKENGVELIVVTEGYNLEKIIDRVYDLSKKRKISLPID